MSDPSTRSDRQSHDNPNTGSPNAGGQRTGGVPAQRHAPAGRSSRAPSLLTLEIERGAQRSALGADARRNELGRRLQQLRGARLRDDVLGHPAPEQVRQLYAELADRLYEEIAAGATVHRRVDRRLRSLPWAVAVLDGLLLYSFCADIFDARFGAVERGGVAAVALAVLGTGLTYVWLTLTGTRLRDYRTELGEVAWRQTGGMTRGLLAGAVVIAATLAVLMDQRVADQAATAVGSYLSADQVPVLAWVFAILSVFANATIVVVHALDGSALGDTVRRLGRLLRTTERGLERARRVAWRRIVRTEAIGSPDVSAPPADDVDRGCAEG